MKKSLCIMAALAALGTAALISGCAQEKKPANTEGAKVIEKAISYSVRADFAPVGEIKEGRKNVYALVKTLNNSYWKEVAQGLEKGAKEADVNLYLGAALREIDWETQKAMLNELNGKKVDAVVLAPTDSTNMIPSAKALRDKKIPVVLVDTTLNSKDFDAAYMTNNAAAGMKACEEMLNLLKANGAKESDKLTVRIMQSSQTSTTIMDRLDGLNSYWNEKAPKAWKLDRMLLIDQGDRAVARNMAAKALKTSNIRGIFTLNNRPTVAAAEVIMKQNRKDVVLMGFDYAPGTAKMIKSPDYKAASIVQNQSTMAIEAVKKAAELAKGAQGSATVVDTGIQVVNAANAEAYEAQQKK